MPLTKDQKRIAAYYKVIQQAEFDVYEALLCITKEREEADQMNLPMARRRLQKVLDALTDITGCRR